MKVKNKTYKEDRLVIKKNIDLSEEWVDKLKVNPINQIIKNGMPSEVFLLIKDVFGYNHKHTLYRLAEKAAFKQSGLHKIFHKGQDKFIDINLDKNQLFFNQLQRIHLIADFGATSYLDPVKKEVIKLLEFQNEDGRFPLYYQHNAHACNELIRLGMEGNVNIDKCANWLIKRQRDDGGWIHKNNLIGNKKLTNTKSCIWTTAEIALFLSKRTLFRQSESNKKACSFLLENILSPNSDSSLLSNEDNWNQLHISSDPEYMFSGGTLKVLEILSLAGYNCSNKIYKKLYEWLLAQQLENGFYPRKVSQLKIADTLTTIKVLGLIRNTELNRDHDKNAEM